MKKLICCIFLSLFAASAFAGAAWVETEKTEADILTEYKHRILHTDSSAFGPYSNNLLNTIVTTDGTYRCAISLPNTANKVPASLIEEQSFCVMVKEPEPKKSKKKKKKKKKRKDDK
ncbi:hypothetical protein imdm_116 [gamma proteobacterium IMCC2047]|nr:hypothetical protein imdm_116 [gamma proteobacterium IMCC2047]